MRRVLEDDGSRQRMIRTIRGVGLRFVAPVEEVAGSAATRQALLRCREAGEDAMRRLDPAEVVAHYRQARSLLSPERLSLLLALGQAETRSGEAEAARETFREACDLARRCGDWAAFGRAALGFAQGEEGGAPNPARVAVLREALDHAPPESPLRARLLGRLGYALWFDEPRERAHAMLAEAEELARRTDDTDALYGVLARAHWVKVGPGRLAERRAISDELGRLADRVTDPVLVATSRGAGIWDALAGADLAGAERQMALLEREALELRVPVVEWWAGVMRAARAFLRGRLAEAEALSAAALEIGRRTGGAWHEATHLIVTEKIRPSARWRSNTFGLAVLLCEALRGEPEGARVELRRQVTSGFAELRDDVNWYNLVHFLVWICEALEEEVEAEAAALYELLLPVADECLVAAPGWLYLGAFERWLGVLASLRRDWDVAAGHFERGLERDRRMGALVCRAEGLVQYGRMLRARGDADAARTSLAEGLALARSMGLGRIEAQARALLASSGREP